MPLPQLGQSTLIIPDQDLPLQTRVRIRASSIQSTTGTLACGNQGTIASQVRSRPSNERSGPVPPACLSLANGWTMRRTFCQHRCSTRTFHQRYIWRRRQTAEEDHAPPIWLCCFGTWLASANAIIDSMPGTARGRTQRSLGLWPINTTEIPSSSTAPKSLDPLSSEGILLATLRPDRNVSEPS